MAPKNKPTIRDLYPHFTGAELKETEENLDRYLELALRIFERITSTEDKQSSKYNGN